MYLFLFLRFDDFLNYLPARLCALSYALFGQTRLALFCWQTQAPLCASPNAGPVMAAGAGALNVSLGGAACYHGKWQDRPLLGKGAPPRIATLKAALKLIRHSLFLWLFLFLLFGVLYDRFA